MSIKNITMETVGLHVGASDWARPNQAILSRAGTLTCAGMSIFGDCSDIGGIASVTIGTADGDSLQKNKKLSLHVKGNTVMKGDSQTDYGLSVSGGKTTQLFVDGDAIFTVGTGGQTLSARFGVADTRCCVLRSCTDVIGHTLHQIYITFFYGICLGEHQDYARSLFSICKTTNT